MTTNDIPADVPDTPVNDNPDAATNADANAEVPGQVTEGGEIPPQGAPETYADFRFTEGASVDGERLSEFTEFAKSNNMTQDQAQSAIDLYSKFATANAEALDKAFSDQVTAWGEASKAKFGAGFDETVEHAKKVLAHYNSPELTEAFEAYGWGNHPELLQVFSDLGKHIGGSTMHGLGGETAAKTDRPLADRMFPNLSK